MTPEMEDRYQALADFMEWVDPEGFALATRTTTRPAERVGQATTEEDDR